MRQLFYTSCLVFALPILLVAWTGKAYCQQEIAFIQQHKLGNSQDSEKRSMQLRDALKLLESHFAVDIVFGDHIIQNYSVSPDQLVLNRPLEENLNRLLEPTSLRYKKIGGKAYSILAGTSKKKQSREKPEDIPAILPPQTNKVTSTLPGDILEPSLVKVKVSGKVTDENGEALPGVSILVKGTQQGTIADANGQFSLDVPDESAVLVFSFVGYFTEEIFIANKLSIEVSLKLDEKSLDEVVVVGYGTQSRHTLSTATATIKGDKIANLPVANAAQALVGQVAGISLQQTSGQPGAPPAIRIRGNGSITSGNSPLYVIDGFPTTDGSLFNSIPPNDIESIDVLKDAASAAIYGSRAGNGVIVITTKKGKSGKPRITFDSFFGLDRLSKKIDLLNADEYVDMAVESLNNQGNPIPAYFTDRSLWHSTDWQDVIFRTAPIHSQQIGVSGGTDKVTYNVSLGNFDQQGILKNSYMKRHNLRASLESRLNSYLKAGVSTMLNFTEERLQEPRGVNTEAGVGGVIAVALSAPPIVPVWKEDGDYFVVFQDEEALKAFNVGLTNPLNKLDANRDFRRSYRQISNGFLELEPISGLRVRSEVNLSITPSRREMYVEGFLAKGGTNLGNVSTPDLTQINALRSNSNNTNLYWSNTATYAFSLSDKHNFTALLGYDVATQGFFNTQVTPRVDADNPVAFTNTIIKNVEGATLKTGTSSMGRYTFDGAFSRLNYDFKGKYILSASLRRDRSSRFGPNQRAGVFSSFSAAWNVMDESFMDQNNYMSQLKLRASYGETGNDQLGGYYPWVSSMSRNNYVFGAEENDVLTMTYSPNGFTNRELGWEKNKQVNLGINLGFFKSRLELTVDVYRRNSNTILSTPIPIINGKSATTIRNIGNVQNQGIEIDLSTRNLTGALNWNTNFNIAFNRNKIRSLGPGQTQLSGATAGSVWANVIRNYVGRPMGDLHMYVVEGTFNNETDLTQYAKNGTQDVGDLRFKDVNNDGRITPDDMTLVGNYQPDFIFGFNNTFTFKNFDFRILLDGSWGGEILNVLERPLSLGRERENNISAALGRWRSESDPGSGFYHKVGTRNLGSNIGPSTRYLYSSSFVRLRNVSLGYTFSSLFGKNIPNCRIYVIAQNVHTFTKFPGYNPEGNHTGDNATVNGADEGTYPLARNISVGINLSF